jgi:EAL domain-containing protein (putative c-di-GMP-specific phosphodiesterase class I)/ActR/RegA family two-component response regulator
VADERQVEITVGIGVGIAGPDGPDAEQRILDAETALHVAKLRGPAEWEMVADDRRRRRSRRPEEEEPLRRALDQHEFVLHYQAKLSLETGRINGAEALIRWQDPTRGLVPPAEFIPVAEETCLIIPIGAWVIGEACAQATRWHERFPRQPPLTVSMNVSVRQFGPHLVQTMAAAIAANGTDPAALSVEVTESLLMSDVDGAIRVLNELAALGVKLSIDDFGTGYSSLAQLKRFPLDELKIDKSFVDGVGRDGDDTAIVAATVAMAHALELSVVAEGVEDEHQLERLRILGCQEAQGYFIARPGPPDAFESLLGSPPGRRAGAPQPVPSRFNDAGRSERILVVDDTDDVRQLARMTLTTVGFEVFEADTGATALMLADRVQPECVILDISMPDMSGIEVCRSLRDNPRTAGCTIIMLTANAGAGDKIGAFAGGADDYIIKPFSPRDLVSRVRAALQREPNDGAGPA